ncbi:short chain enoyl-CoA hydratase /enoyl-CoA hydratase [Actinomycetospora succinea]|uniref:Short chain enoyl-CoA hydratase /enoyl-CoA hydratase n=1 Tax=Actinomycetospora succinea TaxID=663603 RepID=A0A4R6VM08_9PSEU|nr:enoyl-CoA hydratase-related protein [Actinomycetospora succinea]TDQ64779.1 short chain enoyl-CoA hydratase /enoyl-CoA hydratase [Actinomycetospora succinea]
MGSIDVSRDDAVATVTINRPDRLNALDETTRIELADHLAALARDRDVGAIVLTGSGRAFCVGQDLAAVDELDDAHDTVDRTYNPLVRLLAGMDTPVVAAVNGAAVGAGMGLALACDVVLVGRGASMSCAFGRMALVPDSGVAWALARQVGHARAFDLARTGRRVDAEEALALGLATRVVDDAELAATAASEAAALAAGPTTSLALTKRLLRAAADLPLDAVLDREALGQGVAAQQHEHVARRTAFLEKSW